MRVPRVAGSDVERVWAKFERDESGCWCWIAQTSKGYGQFRLGPRMVYAHRWMYETLVGPIPRGFDIDHLCRNTLCVNPAHLEPVTHAENTRRGVSPAAVNAQRTRCVNGHDFTPENTYERTNGNRSCRTCVNEASKRYKQRKRKLVLAQRRRIDG
jgi:hypothetical protein